MGGVNNDQGWGLGSRNQEEPQTKWNLERLAWRRSP